MTDNHSWKLAAKFDDLRVRARMIQAVRRFFRERDFLEVETPLLIPAPAPEVHIDAVAAGKWFLQTSPELCMKRLLAAGYERIYQLCKCFRDKERGERHLPEFTILEWYRANADYRALMDDCEELLSGIAGELGVSSFISRRGGLVILDKPWERITVGEAFLRYARMDVSEALAKDCFEERLTERVEPNLGVDAPVFLYDYPQEQSALARLKEDDPSKAERFELYIDGIEIANAFSELTDAEEQRRRFEEASREREKNGSSVYPIPEFFLDSLPQMPPSAGIALGVDRLAMLFAGRKRIDEVVAFTPELL
ncbi:MAG: EF-P lysine aminoacylase GenX [Syntrophobacterales bacterium]|nr:EF-P lysine aminoacylase GenX [Syntrophobacterales bacterium]